MRAINLLPKDDGRGGASKVSPVAIASVAGLIFVVALVGFLYSGAHGKARIT